MNSTVTRATVATALLLAALVGGFAALRGSREGGEKTEATHPDSPPTAMVAPTLAVPPRVLAKRDAATGAIAGVVRRHGKPAAARVVARRAPDEPAIDADDARLSPTRHAGAVVAEAMTGPDGRFEFARLAPGTYVLDAAGDDGARGRTTIDALAIDDRRTSTIALAAGRETLHGRATALDGRPWRGRVRVLLDGAGQPPYDVENPFVRWASTDDAGRFELAGLSAERVTVQAVEDGAACVMGPEARLPYRGEYVLVVPTEEEGVSGKVVADDGGAPIAGAVVAASDSRLPSVFRRVTGEDGRFRIPLPDASASRLDVSATGFAGARELFGRGDKDVVFHLVRTGTIRGRVTADGDGRAVEGVEVYVSRSRGSQPTRVATTDASGVYEAKDLVAGEIAVYAHGKGWNVRGVERVQSSGWNPFFVTLEPGGSTVADLVVTRAARATGHVRAPDGRPVPGAHVSATPSAPYGDGIAPIGALFGGETATTGDDGAFSLTTLVGGVEYAFDVRADGFPPASAGSRVASEASPIDLDVRLATPRFIDVHVVERGTARPIAGAEVGVTPQGSQERERHEDGWVTGDDGTVRVGPVDAGTYAVGATSPDQPRNWGADPTVTAGEGVPVVTVELESALEIEGRVVLPDGAPAAGARVWCDCDDVNVECEIEYCDGEGRFRFGRLRAGDHSLDASLTSGGRLFRVRTTVAAARRDALLTLVAVPVEESLPDATPTQPARDVSVVDAAGRPVPRATLRLLDPERLNCFGWSQVTDGHATIDADRASRTCWLEVVSPSTAGGSPLPLGVGWSAMAAGTGPVEVRLPAETPIEGTVFGPDGQPIAGVLLEAIPARFPLVTDPRRRAEQIVSRARSDAGGAFHIGRVGPEPSRIYVYAPPGFALPEPMTADGGTRGLAIRLHRGVSPTITVLDADGHPVSGALVSASVAPHEWYLESPNSIVTSLNEGGIARTGALGTVGLVSLDPDQTYDLYVGIPRGRTDILGLDTPAWKPADTTIRLPRTYKVAGVVRDTEGHAVSDAFVKCSIEGHDVGTTYSNDDGGFEIGQLPAGSVDVHATPPGKTEDDELESATAKVEAGATGIALVVRPTVDLAVRVEGWEETGGSVSDGREAVLTREPIADDAPDHWGNPDAHGAMRVRGLTPGATYTLWIAPRRDGRIVYARGLKGGGPEVVVHLEPGEAVRGEVKLPPNSTRPLVHATGPGFSVWVDVGADGRYEFRGLPRGACRLTATARIGDEEVESSVDSKSGQTVDFELKAK